MFDHTQPPTKRTIDFVGEDETTLGLHGTFNTFRVGRKWADLKAGQLVDLSYGPDANSEAYGQDRTIIEDVEVLAVIAAPMDDLIELHAGLNHGCQQTEPAGRKTELRKILRDIYGNFDQGSLGVAIYLSCPSEDA